MKTVFNSSNLSRIEDKKPYNLIKTSEESLQMSQFLPFQERIVNLVEEAKETFYLKKMYETVKAFGQPTPITQTNTAQALEKIDQWELFFQVLAKGLQAVLNLEQISQDFDFIGEQAQNILLLLFALYTFIDKQSPDESRWAFKVRLLILIHEVCILFANQNDNVSSLQRESYYQHALIYFYHDKLNEKPLFNLLDRAFQYPTGLKVEAAMKEMCFIDTLIYQVNDKFSLAKKGSEHKLLLRMALFSQKMIHIFFRLMNSMPLSNQKIAAYCMLVTDILEVVCFYLNLYKYLPARIFIEQIAEIVLYSTEAARMNKRSIHKKMQSTILQSAAMIVKTHTDIPVEHRKILLLAYQISHAFSPEIIEETEFKKINLVIEKVRKTPLRAVSDPVEVKRLLINQAWPGVTQQQKNQWLNQALRMCLNFDPQTEEKQALEWLSISIQVCQAYLSCHIAVLSDMIPFADRCLYLFLKYSEKINSIDYRVKLIAFTDYLAECSIAEPSGIEIKALSTLEEKLPTKILHRQFMPLKLRLSAVICIASERLSLQEDSKKPVKDIQPDVHEAWRHMHRDTCINKISVEKMLQTVEDSQDPEILRNYITFIADFLIVMVSLINGLPQQGTDFALKLEILTLTEEICVLFNDHTNVPGLRMRAYYLGIDNYSHHSEQDPDALDALFKKALAIQCRDSGHLLREIELIDEIFQNYLLNYSLQRVEIVIVIEQFSAKMIAIFRAMVSTDFKEGERQQFLVYLKIVNSLLAIIKNGFHLQTAMRTSLESFLPCIIRLIASLHSLTLTSHQAAFLTEQHALAVLQPIAHFFKNREAINRIDHTARGQLFSIVKTFTPQKITDKTLSSYSWSLKILEMEGLKNKPLEKIEKKSASASLPARVVQPSTSAMVIPALALATTTPPLPRQPPPALSLLPQPAEAVKELPEQVLELKRMNEKLITSSTAKTAHIRKLKAISRNLKKQTKQALAEREAQLEQAARQIAQLTQENQSLSRQDTLLTATQAELKMAQIQRDQVLKAAEALSIQLKTPLSAPPQDPEIAELKQALQGMAAQLAKAKQETDEIRAQSSQQLKEALAKAKQDQDIAVQQTIEAENKAKYAKLKSYDATIEQLKREIRMLQQPGFHEAWKGAGFQYTRRGAAAQEPAPPLQSYASS